jgi:hypothetical protein
VSGLNGIYLANQIENAEEGGAGDGTKTFITFNKGREYICTKV